MAEADGGHAGSTRTGKTAMDAPALGATAAARPSDSRLEEALASQAAFDQKMDDYFFQQSRLAPNGGAAFNPSLSPLWAGLKLPG